MCRIAMVIVLLGGVLSAGQLPAPHKVTDEQVRKVHASALLIDTHNDVTSDTVKGLDIGAARTKGHTDVPRLKKGGVGAVFFAAYVAGSYAGKDQAAHRALEMIDTIRHDIVARHPGDFQLAVSADEILAARRAGKIAALIGIEGGHAIEDSPRLLRQFYALGVRYMTLTHSNHNGWADSSGEVGAPNKGLSALGKQIVAEMNRLGMLVDISHVSDKTFADVLAVSTAPPFASHSSCRALSRIGRNMTDEMIVALARKGGVVQVNFGCEFLSQASADTSTWTNKALKGKKKPGDLTPATLADVVAHIEHVIRVAGEDAVGVGSDFDGVECVPVGLPDVSQFPALTRALLERGHSAARIRKIYGENFLRVMRAAEAKARN
ncbi:MAG: membrane dipeptidase [Acidobacteria bacterium]|nr:membrane dipeptidase [Acidobacteriota bacterium]